MSQHKSNLLKAAIALALLTVSAALWVSPGASATHASLTIPALASPTAVCPTPGNNACIANTPTVVLTLNGTNQPVTYTLAFTLANNTPGSWHETITSTQFTAGGHSLPTSASSVTAVTIVPNCTGNTCPQNTISYPVSVPAGNTAPTPVTFYNNNPGSSNHGQGTFTIQATIQVTVPANTYTGNYTSTITIGFVSGSS